ncbi:hypothetical protein M3J09_002795 [Ascochyta lentis]
MIRSSERHYNLRSLDPVGYILREAKGA